MLLKILGIKSDRENKNPAIVHQLWQESLFFPFCTDETIDYSGEYLHKENNCQYY